MVVALKPGRFYGRALPRPRFFDDTKLNDHRVSPPPSVNGSFLHWAQDAHWSMGGLSFKRTRMQGKIEGKISKLRSERSTSSSPSLSAKKKLSKGKAVVTEQEEAHHGDEQEQDERQPVKKKRLVRKALLLDDAETNPGQVVESPLQRSSKRAEIDPHQAGPSKGFAADDEEISEDSQERAEGVPSTPIVSNRSASKRVLLPLEDSPRSRRIRRLAK